MLFFGAVDEKLAWYISRSSGLIAWVVITASIVWGLALSTRLIRRRGAPAWLLDLHRYLGTLSLVFTLIHVITLLFDSYAHITIKELFVPFQSVGRNGYNPQAAAWGIAGVYMLVAIQLTSWLKKRLPRKFWHGVHLLSIPLFFVATIHGFKAGSEKANPLVFLAVVVGSTLFFFLFLFRVFSVVGQDDRAAARKLVKTTDDVEVDTDTAEGRQRQRGAVGQRSDSGQPSDAGQRGDVVQRSGAGQRRERGERNPTTSADPITLVVDAAWSEKSIAISQGRFDVTVVGQSAGQSPSVNEPPIDQAAIDRAARVAALQASRRERVSTR